MMGVSKLATAGALLGLVMSSAGVAQMLVKPKMPAAKATQVESDADFLAPLKAPEPVGTSPVRPGDNKLTCPQILAEAQARQKEFGALLAKAESTTPAMSARTAGLLAAAEVATTIAPMSNPYGNEGAAAVAAGAVEAYKESAWNDTNRAMAPIEQRIDFAEARGNYLNDLYRTKCFKKKGRAPTTLVPLAANTTAPAPTPAAPPAPVKPTRAPTATAANAAGAPAPNLPVDEMDCPTLLAESQRLRKTLEGDVAAMMGAVQSYKPVGQSVGGVAQAASSIASAVLPGMGAVLDAVNSGRQVAQKAAQQAQMAAFENKIQKQSEGQMALGWRITELETAHEERCGT